MSYPQKQSFKNVIEAKETIRKRLSEKARIEHWKVTNEFLKQSYLRKLYTTLQNEVNPPKDEIQATYKYIILDDPILLRFALHNRTEVEDYKLRQFLRDRFFWPDLIDSPSMGYSRDTLLEDMLEEAHPKESLMGSVFVSLLRDFDIIRSVDQKKADGAKESIKELRGQAIQERSYKKGKTKILETTYDYYPNLKWIERIIGVGNYREEELVFHTKELFDKYKGASDIHLVSFHQLFQPYKELSWALIGNFGGNIPNTNMILRYKDQIYKYPFDIVRKYWYLLIKIGEKYRDYVGSDALALIDPKLKREPKSSFEYGKFIPESLPDWSCPKPKTVFLRTINNEEKAVVSTLDIINRYYSDINFQELFSILYDLAKDYNPAVHGYVPGYFKKRLESRLRDTYRTKYSAQVYGKRKPKWKIEYEKSLDETVEDEDGKKGLRFEFIPSKVNFFEDEPSPQEKLEMKEQKDITKRIVNNIIDNIDDPIDEEIVSQKMKGKTNSEIAEIIRVKFPSKKSFTRQAVEKRLKKVKSLN